MKEFDREFKKAKKAGKIVAAIYLALWIAGISLLAYIGNSACNAVREKGLKSIGEEIYHGKK